MKILIFICLIAFTHAFTTQEIIQKLDGKTNFGFTIELKDGSIIRNACFFTKKTFPKGNTSYNKLKNKDDYIFIPRVDMTLAITKDNLKNVRITGSNTKKYLVFKNYDILYNAIIEKSNFYTKYQSKLFGKIKVKNRNISNKPPTLVTDNNKNIVKIVSRVYIPSACQSINGLKELKNITMLNLNDTQVADISVLKNLSNLTQLNLSNTKVANISVLKNLSRLSELDLSYTKVEDISALKNLLNLRDLYLSYTKVEDISALKDMHNLWRLNVSNTQISDISSLNNLSRLSELDLSYTKVENLNLRDLPILRSLDLTGSSLTTIVELKNLPRVEWIILSDTKVSDISALKNLNLEGVYLNNTKVENISALKNLLDLGYLNLNNTKVENISVLKNLQYLGHLDLSDTKVENISALKNFPSLRDLDLSDTKVENISALKNLLNLGYLNLNNTKVENINGLKNLQYLKYLELSNTKVTNFTVLKYLDNLHELDISNNKSFDCKVLAKLTSLEVLNIINTKVVNFEEFPFSLKRLSLNQKEINLTNLSQRELIHFDFKNKNHLEQVMKSKIQGISFESFKGDFSFIKDMHPCYRLNFTNTNFADLTLLKKQVRTLEFLSIENCPIKDFSFLKKFKSLSVYLNVTNEKLQELKKQYPNISFRNSSN